MICGALFKSQLTYFTSKIKINRKTYGINFITVFLLKDADLIFEEMFTQMAAKCKCSNHNNTS
jgi:hypothetical protein